MRKNWNILKNTGKFEEKLEYFEKNWKIWKTSENLVRNERQPQTKPENLGENQKRFLARKIKSRKMGEKISKNKNPGKNAEEKSTEKNPRKWRDFCFGF